MSKTVVGLFSTIAQAHSVKQALISEGHDPEHIAVVASDENNTTATEGTSTGTGVGQKISNFFHSLTGGDEEVHEHYARGVNQGGGLVAVKTGDDEAEEVAAVLRQHGAADIDDDYAETATGTAAVPAYDESVAPTGIGQTAIPVVEEELVVGKREVDRGGVRVYSHVVTTPVAADVTLRDESILIERRPVNRVATAADFEAGRGSMIELTAMGEEAVVGKTSRVVEEVLVGKTASSHTEAIHDSVRRTEVDVEEIPTNEAATTQTY